jgi:hypothetical protein
MIRSNKKPKNDTKTGVSPAKRSTSMSALFPEDSSDDDETSPSFVKGVGLINQNSKQNNGDPAAITAIEGDNPDDSGEGFTINKNYAERYDSWRNKEQLMKSTLLPNCQTAKSIINSGH